MFASPKNSPKREFFVILDTSKLNNVKKLFTTFAILALLSAGCNQITEINRDTQNQSTELQTYTNQKYKYQFDYPEGAIVKETPAEFFSSSAGDTPDATYKRLGGEVCITVEYKNAGIAFSAPQNQDLNAACLRSGVGTEAEFSNEKLTIFNEEVTGDRIFEGTSESIRFNLKDGTKIEISGGGETEQAYREYLKVKPEILNIIQSYRKL